MSSGGESLWPSLRTITAFTSSSPNPDGTPITAHSITAGCSMMKDLPLIEDMSSHVGELRFNTINEIEIAGLIALEAVSSVEPTVPPRFHSLLRHPKVTLVHRPRNTCTNYQLPNLTGSDFVIMRVENLYLCTRIAIPESPTTLMTLYVVPATDNGDTDLGHTEARSQAHSKSAAEFAELWNHWEDHDLERVDCIIDPWFLLIKIGSSSPKRAVVVQWKFRILFQKSVPLKRSRITSLPCAQRLMLAMSGWNHEGSGRCCKNPHSPNSTPLNRPSAWAYICAHGTVLLSMAPSCPKYKQYN